MPIPVSGAKLRFLDQLCKHGYVDYLTAVMIVSGERCDGNTDILTVVVSQLRKLLPREIEIRAIRNSGYELIITEGE